MFMFDVFWTTLGERGEVLQMFHQHSRHQGNIVLSQKAKYSLVNSHQSLKCIKLQYTLQHFGPEGPSSGNNTVLEHTKTSNAGGYLYIQGMIAS